ALTARVGQPSFTLIQAQELLSVATDEGLDELAGLIGGLASANIPALAWTLGWMYAILARIGARQGQAHVALRYLNLCVPWLERAPMWTVSLPIAVSHAGEALWVTERLENVDVVEFAVREKVIEPDFRCPMVDGRLTLARLCALQGRHEEAQKWLGEARRVLDEQGALPLLAIADYDEALMFARRGAGRDAERARPVLAAARRQFVELGMTGWVRRAQELAQQLR
ncbi:MAG: hypothetical protein LC792_16580, partial [Actinobacteria bacterium]|nr:hypothetical protein [Actinomycetota bacterium]